ncbi:malonate decarboxylase subunit epsilon [Paenibacillus sp. sgz500992]|uniref:malonate decarboxylase subunit epsilon n=1 Tax=Paenibacillus sp. sgz500992 TaxID=3242476 RepID=UPI0036D39F85
MSIAYLFPGQGSQAPGMLHDLPKHPIITEKIEEASMVLGEDALTLDTNEALSSSTRAVQLSLLIHEVAAASLLKSKGAVADMVGGHSIGAFAAAVVCGSLRFSDAVAVVELRGRLMEEAYPSGFGMGVIIGLDERHLTLLITKINTENNPVYIANLNAQDQITIAGSISAVEQVFTLARSIGAYKTKLLDVSVPSHCRLLSSVSNELTKELKSVKLKDSNIPYIGNCRARVLRKAEEIRNDLSEGVANPVRWHEGTTLMFERGTRLFIEIGPGDTLTNLAKKGFPDSRCISAMNSGLDSAMLLITREREKCNNG